MAIPKQLIKEQRTNFFILIKQHKIIFITSVFSCFIAVLLLLVKIYMSMTYLPDISGSETSTILPIQRLTAGLSIYTDPEKPLFLMTQYTPLYITFVSELTKLMSVSPFQVHKIFMISRFASILFTVLSMAILWVIIYKNTKNNKLLATLGACFSYQILCSWFLTSSRPDSLLVFCTSLFIYSIIQACQDERRESTWWYVGIFISVTAFFVKQSGAIHSIVLGAFLISQGRWKLLLKLIFSGIFIFTIYLFILPTGDLEIFFTNIIGGVANSVSWGWFYDWTLEKLLFPFAPILAVNTAISINGLFYRRDQKIQLLSMCSIGFFIFAISTSLKIGAGVGYFEDYLIVSVVLTVVYFYERFDSIFLNKSVPVVILCFYLCIVSIHCFLFVFTKYSSNSLVAFKNKYVEQQKIAKYFIEDEKLKAGQWVYICGSSNFNGYFLNHFLYNNNLIPFLDIVFLANKNSTFDFSAFDTIVKNSKIRFVICEKGTEPKTIFGGKFTHLKKVKSTENLEIYKGY